jgi:hypothetical protein
MIELISYTYIFNNNNNNNAFTPRKIRRKANEGKGKG